MRIGILAPVATEDVAHLLADTGGKLPPGYPGAPFIATLIETYLQMGHEVVAFTSDKTLGRNGTSQRLDGPGFRLWICPSRPNGTLPRRGSLVGRIWDFFKFEREQLLAAVNQETVDILHAHWTYEFAMVAQASGRPCIATIHDAPKDVLRMAPSPYTYGRYLMGRQVLKSGIPLTAVSPYVASAAKEEFSNIDIPTISNPLPIWLRNLSAGSNRTPEAQSAKTIAMVLGHWTKFKNPLPALCAFSSLTKELGSSVELRLYGTDFAPGGKAENEIRKAGLSNSQIRFMGRRQHRMLLKEIAEAHVFLHPSLTESFGMAVAEAMALGVPVIAGHNSGAIPWLLHDGAAGRLVDVNNPKAIHAALKADLSGDLCANEIASYAKQAIWESADPLIVGENYLATYKGILQ